jgi:hypothetical protein
MADPIAGARKLSTKLLKPLRRENGPKRLNSAGESPIEDLESANEQSQEVAVIVHPSERWRRFRAPGAK